VNNCVFERNQDDGFYGEDDASIVATDSQLLHNSPYAVRVVGNARVSVDRSVLFGNAAKASQPEGRQSIRWGERVIEKDPR
jgi:hypothetical protein